MLRNVCDVCSEVIDGEPIAREYPEAVLLIDSEVELMYENLCPTCRRALIESVAAFRRGPGEPVRPSDAPAIAAPADAEHGENSAKRPLEPECARISDENVTVDANDGNTPSNPIRTDDSPKPERKLANQVVKQYPVKLPQRNQN